MINVDNRSAPVDPRWSEALADTVAGFGKRPIVAERLWWAQSSHQIVATSFPMTGFDKAANTFTKVTRPGLRRRKSSPRESESQPSFPEVPPGSI
jgi:hypothetical protein